MRQIDKLVAHLLRFNADALVAISNAPVVLRTDSGDRTSTQVLDHAAIVAIVTEVAPAPNLHDVRQGRSTRFGYDGTGEPVTIDVAPAGAAWRLVISPGAPVGFSRAPSAPAPAIAVSVPAPPAPPWVPAPSSLPTPHVSVSIPPAPRISDASALRGAALDARAPSLRPGTTDTRGIDRLLRAMTAAGASDLHLSTTCPPLVRLHGEILRMEDTSPYTDEFLRALLLPLVPPRNREEFERRRDTDFGYEIAGLARFRANLFLDRNGIGAVFRRIPFEIVTAEQLDLPPSLLEFCTLSKGLVLVTGPTGSGKSTTLAALVDRINSTRDDHIITIEDPIEFVHEDKRCLIHQREVRLHTDGFRQALRAALRQDPDIVLVGEMRDLETIEIAIETAETGHLVFATLHTSTAPSTVDRIIDQFPADRQSQIRTMLSESLRGVVAQTLCKKKGGGRVAAYEVLVGSPAIANLIREGKSYQIYGQMQTSRGLGMATLGDALFDLVTSGKIEPREAYLKAVNKTEIRTMLQGAGFEVPE